MIKTLSHKQLTLVLGLWLIALAVSAQQPSDWMIWWMEVMPVLLAIPILLVTRNSFPLPRYILIWIFIHGLVLILGGHYTYAKVPLGFWLQDLLHFERNPYDRIGHLFQGFVPALIAREILLRKADLQKKAWLFFLTVTICVFVSVLYEFIEWWSAIYFGQSAEAFLGTQGDPWDTHWDIFLALIGALVAQIIYPVVNIPLEIPVTETRKS